MFPSLAARETDIAETIFAVWKQKLFYLKSKKIYCFSDTKVAFETYVSKGTSTVTKKEVSSDLFESRFIIMRMSDPLLSETMFPQ